MFFWANIPIVVCVMCFQPKRLASHWAGLLIASRSDSHSPQQLHKKKGATWTAPSPLPRRRRRHRRPQKLRRPAATTTPAWSHRVPAWLDDSRHFDLLLPLFYAEPPTILTSRGWQATPRGPSRAPAAARIVQRRSPPPGHGPPPLLSVCFPRFCFSLPSSVCSDSQIQMENTNWDCSEL